MSRTRFSVIVPAYNAACTVRAAIRSTLSQTCADFELLVVDDGSTDDTGRRVEECTDPRVKLLRQRNSGPSAARNAGIAAARGRYLAMLDSDSLLLPTYLETMGRALDAEPAAGLAYTDAWGLDLAAGRLRRATVMSLANPRCRRPAAHRSS